MKPRLDPKRDLAGATPETLARALSICQRSFISPLFYTGNQFPSGYHGGAFLAFHGSWNRSKRTGYSVAFIPFQEGEPLTGPQDFLTGFMLGPDKREVWGRPVGLFQMQDGSLLVSEDGGNKVWRIFYE